MGKFLSSARKFVVGVVKREPVALWGTLVALVVQVVLPLIHVSWVGTEVPVVLTLLGIPVVRSKVTASGVVSAVLKDTETAVSAQLASKAAAAPVVAAVAVTPPATTP